MTAPSIYFRKKDQNAVRTLVLLHGNSSSSRTYDALFANENIKADLLAIDLPGHGKSHRSEKTANYGFGNFKKTVLETILQNIENEIILVGHSLGGHIAMEIAPHLPQLQGLVLFGAPPLRGSSNLQEAFTDNEVLPFFFQKEVSDAEIGQLTETAMWQKERAARVQSDFRNTDALVRPSVAASLADDLEDEVSILQSLNIPKHILHGRQDPLVRLDYLKSTAKETGTDLRIVEECGHFLSLERPEVLLEALA